MAVFTCISITAKAQEPVFTQPLAMPLYYNPAWAGMQQNLRAGMLYRNQWRNLFTSYLAAADMQVPKINSGLGIILEHNELSNGVVTNTSAHLVYNYEFKIKKTGWLRIGVDENFIQKTVDYSKITFVDDPYNPANAIQRRLYRTNIFPNTGVGALFYTDQFYAGVSVANLFQPDVSFFADPSGVLPRRFTLQGGAFLGERTLIFNPNLMVVEQGGDPIISAGLTAIKDKFSAGASFRYSNAPYAVSLAMGFHTGMFKIGYSYDYNLLPDDFGGTHEVSLVFQWNKPRNMSAKPIINHFRNTI